MTIEEFIAARLAEDEALIRRNSDGHGLADGYPDYRTYSDRDTAAADEYVEHFGPARLLREAEAKRRILDAYQVEINGGFGGDNYTEGLEFALKHIAATWSDHADYDGSWKP